MTGAAIVGTSNEATRPNRHAEDRPDLRHAYDGTDFHAKRLLLERGAFILKTLMPQSEYTMNIFYIIGVVVVVVVVAGFFGLRV